MSDNTLDLTRYKTSSIGTDVDATDDQLKVEYKYTAIGYFFVWFFGTTRMPIEINFTCLQTGEVFEKLTDKTLIEHYMLYRRK